MDEALFDGHKQHMDFFLLNNSLSSAEIMRMGIIEIPELKLGKGEMENLGVQDRIRQGN